MPSATGTAAPAGRRTSPAGSVTRSPSAACAGSPPATYGVASGNVTGWGSESSTTRPPSGALRYSWPNSAARSGSPPRCISSRHAGSAIANVFSQYWKACT